MRSSQRPRLLAPGFALGGLLLCALVGTLATEGSASPASPARAAANRYIGAAKCKSCHSSEETGDQYGHWGKAGHSKAFEALASDEAKKLAQEKGIADAQKADECLRCHVTAHGQPEDMIRKGFEPAAGVQCETCHGPGEAHMKARLAAASSEDPSTQKVEAGEIVNSPPADLCVSCHSTDSPSYQPFCYFKAKEKIRHLNPKKERTEAEQKELAKKCGCGDACPTEKCAKGECGVDG
jgi:hypothetical protein